MRIGNQIVNKQSILCFIKNKTSIFVISEPRKLSNFFSPEYLISGSEFYYNTESECSNSFENIIKNDILNNYTHKNDYNGYEFSKMFKKAYENEK